MKLQRVLAQKINTWAGREDGDLRIEIVRKESYHQALNAASNLTRAPGDSVGPLYGFTGAANLDGVSMVAIKAGKLVGQASFAIEHRDQTLSLRIDGIFVDADERGAGIATKLVGEIERLVEAACTAVPRDAAMVLDPDVQGDFNAGGEILQQSLTAAFGRILDRIEEGPELEI